MNENKQQRQQIRASDIVCNNNALKKKNANIRSVLWPGLVGALRPLKGEKKSVHLLGGSKGVINLSWNFYAMRSLVLAGHFRNISGHLFTWLVGGSFQ